MTDSRAPARPPVRLEQALRELARVHDLEQSRLLRAASLLRLRHARSAREPRIPPPRSRRELRGCHSTEGWRAEALEEVRTARTDGARVDATLADLARALIDSWPSAASIAAAALELEPGSESTLALARARLATRELEGALVLLLDLLRHDPLEDHRLAALEAVALGLELAGDLEGSLAFQEAALNSKGSDLRQAVPLLTLALCSGDGPRAALASTRLHGLDLAVPGVRSRFDAELSAVRHRASRQAVPAWRAGGRGPCVREFLRRNRGPEAEVAKLLLQG
jgi:hypothetical protein